MNKIKESLDNQVDAFIDDKGVKWAPLVDILHKLQQKGFGKTMKTLIRDLRARGIRCEKQPIKSRMTLHPIWAISIEDYRDLQNQIKHCFYLIQLDPNNPSPCNLLIKLGISNNPNRRNGEDFKTLAPNAKVIGKWFAPPTWELAAITYATKDLCFPESKELFMCLSIDGIELIKTRLDCFFTKIMPSLESKPLNKSDYKFVDSMWILKESKKIEEPDENEEELIPATNCVSVVELRKSMHLEETNMLDYASLIKQYRTKHNLTQEQFGELIGVTGRAVGYYETKKNTPQSEYADKILNLLIQDGMLDNK